MKIEIRIRSDGLRERTACLEDGTHTIGGLGCDVTLSYPTVSRQHGRITVGDGIVSFRDLSSRNGSRLRSAGSVEALGPDEERPWRQDEALMIGPFELVWTPFQEPASTSSQIARHAEHYARLLAEHPATARDLFYDSLADEPARDSIVEDVYREFHGHGPVQVYLDDPACREILVNAHDRIFFDRGQGLVESDRTFLTRESYEAWAVRLAHESGRRLDVQNPICEASLADGARYHAVLSPISARNLSVSIRRFGSAPVTEARAIESGWLDGDSLPILRDTVRHRRNVVISGGTSTGKTSLLNFLCSYVPSNERVITVEDTVELSPPIRNLVQLQARTANADGVGLISVRSLLQSALRMRPDRIIVGECRGAEVLDMLQALNTGHPGSLTTVHANSPAEALRRLELLALLGATNISVECVREWIAATVDVLVQLERCPDGHRRVAEISMRGSDGHFNTVYGSHDRQVG